MFKNINKDIEAILTRDPAARNIMEIILCYPGLHALIIHRIAHKLFNIRFRLVARILSIFNRFITGIDIHPAAKIGTGLFIDHGMGVVIGETVEIGDNVTIYQGATLGGTGKEIGKRHPTVGNNVVISSGAKVLGPFKVGDNSKIGAGAVVLKEVPPNCTVVGVPGRIVKSEQKKITSEEKVVVDLDQVTLPDPIHDQLKLMVEKINMLEEKVNILSEELLEKVI